MSRLSNGSFSFLVYRSLSLLLIFLSLQVNVFAERPSISTPPALSPWVEWVQDRNPDWKCPLVVAEFVCDWPGRLELTLNEKGGAFRYFVSLTRDKEIQIPGGNEVWPVDLSVESSGRKISAALVRRDDLPTLFLGSGTYVISGRFIWSEIPETLAIPVSTGIISATLNGKVLETQRADNGELWLRKIVSDDTQEQDSAALTVSRLLSDGVPFRIFTHIQLRVSGRARELNIGRVIPPTSSLIRVNSPFSYSLDNSGNFKIQAKPGEYSLDLESVMDTPPETLGRVENNSELWPEEEIWAWKSDEILRSVDVSGGSPIDPQRTDLPAEWRTYPAYVVQKGELLTFRESRRGEVEPRANAIQLQRYAWLDLDGTGYTVRDTLNIQMHQGWRLNADPELALGRVTVDGLDQLITKDPITGNSGLETRAENSTLIAESRLENMRSELPAIGWAHDMDRVSVSLALPPGWTLIEALGVDNSGETWWSSWTLFELFLILLLSVSMGRLYGARWCLATGLALIIGHEEPRAPWLVWFHLIVSAGLLKAVPPSKIADFIRLYFRGLLALAGLLLLRFTIFQVRRAIYPQLDQYTYGDDIESTLCWGLFFVTIIFALLRALSDAIQSWWKRMLVALASLWALSYIVSILFTGLFFGSNFQGGSFSERQYSSDAPVMQPMTAPSAPPSDSEDLREQGKVFEEAAGIPSRSKVVRKSTSSLKYNAYQQLREVDPNAVIQTGQGIPEWTWRTWNFSWTGPVAQGHKLSLYLLSPFWTSLLCLLRVCLYLLLAYRFVSDVGLKIGFAPQVARTAMRIAIGLLALTPHMAQAQNFPSERLLTELQTRLEQNRCKEFCTTANEMHLQVRGSAVSLSASVHSDGYGAVALPGPADQLTFTQVKLDGVDTQALRVQSDGLLWVRIPDGAHALLAQGELKQATVATLQFGIDPGTLSVDAPDWTVDGISSSGSVNGSIQLIREERAEKSSPAGTPEGSLEGNISLPNWYSVSREISIGVNWSVTTRVQRLGSSDRAETVKVPLLVGESVMAQDVKVENGEAIVAFGRDMTTVEWTGNVEQAPSLKFQAASGRNFSEKWKVLCSPIYRCESKALSPVLTRENQRQLYSWVPWPGEIAQVDVQKPLAVSGANIAIDKVSLNYRPGTDILAGDLSLRIRNSRGGVKRVELSADAIVREIREGGNPINTPAQKGVIELPLKPGQQEFQILWEQPWKFEISQRMPAIRIDGESVNNDLTVSLPERRFVLFLGGPAWGPAVLFWGTLVVVLLFSWILGRSELTPLRAWQWALLGLGLALVSIPEMIVPVFWFAALSFRNQVRINRPWVFNLVQLGIVLLSLITFGVLYHAIQSGLLFQPDMQVSGKDSSNLYFHWYLDRSNGNLPQPTVISLPIICYRAFMLGWSCWLVFSLLKWVKWGWDVFSGGGIWHSNVSETSPSQTAS